MSTISSRRLSARSLLIWIVLFGAVPTQARRPPWTDPHRSPAARASDPILDVLRAHGGDDVMRGDGPLDPETRRFVEGAQIEGEIRDAHTDQLLAAGLDRRRREGALPVDTWANVDRALGFWADRPCARLEARTGGRGTR